MSIHADVLPTKDQLIDILVYISVFSQCDQRTSIPQLESTQLWIH